ncbi:MAG: helix-turn-helix transcriptional regulator [Bdellovibrionales bacterium]|nr:helix-turn-helix transcriptional regulator [Bdellovibrionales bacterium]
MSESQVNSDRYDGWLSKVFAQPKVLLAVCLFFISLFVSLDIFEDYSEGASNTHLIIELLILTFSSGVFIFILLSWIYEKKQTQTLKVSVEQLNHQRTELQKELQSHMQGLSKIIENQFQLWSLTKSEKEVGFLLLKGFSLKEIADIRQCSEKTVQAQSQAIYKKSNCRGRSEFSAYFLEDLLPPQNLL